MPVSSATSKIRHLGPGASLCVEEFDIESWVGRNYKTWNIDEFPGTTCILRNGYTIVGLCTFGECPDVEANSTLETMFGMQWHGNLLVFKRAIKDVFRVVGVTPREISLIDTLVHR